MIVIMGLSWSATEELVRLGLWHIIISISYCAGLFASSVPCVVPPTLIFPLPPPPPPPPKYQRATPIPFRGTGSQRRSTSLSENARRKRGARASPPPLPLSSFLFQFTAISVQSTNATNCTSPAAPSTAGLGRSKAASPPERSDPIPSKDKNIMDERQGLGAEAGDVYSKQHP